MSNFKDFIQEDINTFINFDEFGEEHNINGNTIVCIIDEDISKERNINKESQNFNGVYTDSISLFIRKEDIEVEPIIEEQYEVDKDVYKVSNVSESEGIYEIELTRNDY